MTWTLAGVFQEHLGLEDRGVIFLERIFAGGGFGRPQEHPNLKPRPSHGEISLQDPRMAEFSRTLGLGVWICRTPGSVHGTKDLDPRGEFSGVIFN